jgi:hypothetical protein
VANINLLEDVAPASNELGAITEAAERVLSLEEEIRALENQLKDKGQTLKKLTEQELPDLMQELNVKDFTLTNGAKIGLVDIVSASIPSAGQINRAKGDVKEELLSRQKRCHNWIRKNYGEALIVSNIEVPFGKHEDKKCSEFKKQLRKDKVFYNESTGVHPQTLKAFIRECLGKGINVPVEDFRLYTGQKVQIRRP